MRGLVAFEWAEAGRASVPGAGGLAVWVQGGDPALCPTLGAAGFFGIAFLWDWNEN